jgi:DNA-binding transcriptional regulator YhcF (GntR family)
MSQQGELKKDYAYRRILEMILNDEVLEDHFPAEPEFCRQLGIARVTLRSAFKRLEKEGYITRSHYYGTRIVRNRTEKRLLIAATRSLFFNSKITSRLELEVDQLTAICRERNIPCDSSSLYFLQDAEKIAERYSGVIFFGAAMRGDEPFLQVLEESGVPAVYIREDENNNITDRFASVGPNIREAWIAGFEYLAKLGFRRIATLFSHDKRNFQRLGFDRDAFEDFLKQRGFTEAAEMICNVTADQNTPAEQIRSFIEEKNPDAVYCYSDSFAAELYRVLHEMGRKIPQDIAVLSFGMGSDLLTPTLSAVQLNSPLFGQTVLSLLEYLQENPGKAPFIELPYHILENDSTAIVRLEGMMNESFKV